jgi:hypothetical protein
MSEYDTREENIKWKPGVFHGLQPDPNGCSNKVAEMARDGWVLISQTEHPNVIGLAHTKLIFRKISRNSNY